MTRGGLTDADRDWLHGEKEYSHTQTEGNRRRKIRERTIQSLRDFELLAQELPQKDRRKIFKQFNKESDSDCVDEIAFVIEFIYKGLNDVATEPETVAEAPDSDAVGRFLAFRRALVSGIEQGKEEFNPSHSTTESPKEVIIASNEYLFEFPSFDEVRSELTPEKWEQLAKSIGEPTEIANHNDVTSFLRLMTQAQIHEFISARHQQVDKDIKDYNPIW